MALIAPMTLSIANINAIKNLSQFSHLLKAISENSQIYKANRQEKKQTQTNTYIHKHISMAFGAASSSILGTGLELAARHCGTVASWQLGSDINSHGYRDESSRVERALHT